MAEWVAPAEQFLRTSWERPDFQFRWHAILSDDEREVLERFLEFRRGKYLADGSFLNMVRQDWEAKGHPATTKQIERIREDGLAKLGWEWNGIDQRARLVLIQANRDVKQLLALAESCTDQASLKDWKRNMLEALRETRERLQGANGQQKPLSQTLMVLFDRLRAGDFGMVPTAAGEFVAAYKRILDEELTAMRHAEEEREHRERVEAEIRELIRELRATGDEPSNPAIARLVELSQTFRLAEKPETLVAFWPDVDKLIELSSERRQSVEVFLAEEREKLDVLTARACQQAKVIEPIEREIIDLDRNISAFKAKMSDCIRDEYFAMLEGIAHETQEKKQLLYQKHCEHTQLTDERARLSAEIESFERELETLELIPAMIDQMCASVNSLANLRPELLDLGDYRGWIDSFGPFSLPPLCDLTREVSV